MTGEVTTLLGEMAEKGRLEQEMFAAREIQQKLLPTGPLRVTGLARLGILRTGARSGGGLLRLPADHRLDSRRADRRRRRQGPRRRPLHGAAEGDRPVAVAAASRAEGIPDGGQQGGLGKPRRQELHHDDLRRDRRRAARDDVRARRALPADPRPGEPAGRHAQGPVARARRPRRRPADRRRDDVRFAAEGADDQRSSRAT